jgi:hypothetical protein
MARRLTLVGVFVVIEQGSMMQLMIGTAFSACYMLLQMQVDPYAEKSSDFLANGCSFALLVFFLCCIAFKVRPSAHLVKTLHVLYCDQHCGRFSLCLCQCLSCMWLRKLLHLGF